MDTPGPVVVRERASRELFHGPTHQNVGWEISWIERGRLEHTMGRDVVAASAGACLLMPPGIVHTPRTRTVRFHQVTVMADAIEEAADAFDGAPPRRPDVIGEDARLTALVRLIATETTEARAPLLDALAISLVKGASDGPRARVDRRVRRALDRVASDFAAPLSVDDLAAEAGMSRFAFLRAFRAQVGESPYQHLQRVRLDRAAERLRAGDEPVLAIALSCGFGDPGRFARAFRARFGRTPREWRHDSPNRGSIRRDVR